MYPGGGRSGVFCPGAPVGSGNADADGLKVRIGPLALGPNIPEELVGAALAGIADGATVGASSGLAGRGSTAPRRMTETASTSPAPRRTMAPMTQASGTFDCMRILMLLPINAPTSA